MFRDISTFELGGTKPIVLYLTGDYDTMFRVNIKKLLEYLWDNSSVWLNTCFHMTVEPLRLQYAMIVHD